MSVAEFAACVGDVARPIAQRMRAVFLLRTAGGAEAVRALCGALKDKRGSCLFRHEIGYVLGQLGDSGALPDLIEVLSDVEDDPIVRHECAEALAAIGDAAALPVLERFCSDARKEVSETCEIAVRSVRWQQSAGSAGRVLRDEANPFESVDPAPPCEADGTAAAATTKAAASEAGCGCCEEGVCGTPSEEEAAVLALPIKERVAALRARLLNPALPLFERYRAMFSLRNLRTDDAVLALCAGFEDDSALFRHEIAYVLGQLQRPIAFDALRAALLNAAEHEMVRHEAAEALGAIGTEACVQLLREHLGDSAEVVRQSCEVALDVVDYWEGFEAGTEAGVDADALKTGSGAAKVAEEVAGGGGGVGGGAEVAVESK